MTPQEKDFIKQTAIDYDLCYEVVKDVYKKYGPDKIYQELENLIKENW